MPSIEYDAAIALAGMGMYLFPMHTARQLTEGTALCTCAKSRMHRQTSSGTL